MFSKFIVCLVLFCFSSTQVMAFVLNGKLRTPTKRYQVNRIVNSYKRQQLETVLNKFLFSTRPGRLVGSAGHGKTVDYLVDLLKSYDQEGQNTLIVDEFSPDIDHAVKMYRDDFKNQIESKYKPEDKTYQYWKNFTDKTIKFVKSLKDVKGKNLIWEKRGLLSPDELIVIGVHYDTISHDPKTKVVTPNIPNMGADDNASGIAVALALIEILTEMELAKSVRVVFFDFQQTGFLGSHAFLKKYSEELKKNKKLAGYVQLVMLGHDTKAKDKEKKFGNFKVYTRSEANGGLKEINLAKKLIGMGEKVTRNIKFEHLDNGFNNCDHINFWNEGIPAVVFSQNWETDLNPRYHTQNDFSETLNTKSLYYAFQFITGSIISWNFDIL